MTASSSRASSPRSSRSRWKAPRASYSGTIASALLELAAERGASVTPTDLAAYAAVWSQPSEVQRLGRRWLTRGGISRLPETVAVLPSLRTLTPTERLLTLVAALDGEIASEQHTTNLVAVDATGNACVLTTSLGLGSGDYLPGLDLHLNSVLGEADLLAGGVPPVGRRIQTMMSPTLVFDGDELVLAAGAAGGTRMRTALLTAAAGVLDEEREPQNAVDCARVHPAGTVVNAEPGADEDGLAALEAAGRTVRRWPERHHYFGGVSLIGRCGGAADPRRSGAALGLDD